MTKLEKLTGWLDQEIAEYYSAQNRLSGYSSLRWIAYMDVKKKLEEFDTEEYWADLTSAGY